MLAYVPMLSPYYYAPSLNCADVNSVYWRTVQPRRLILLSIGYHRLWSPVYHKLYTSLIPRLSWVGPGCEAKIILNAACKWTMRLQTWDIQTLTKNHAACISGKIANTHSKSKFHYQLLTLSQFIYTISYALLHKLCDYAFGYVRTSPTILQLIMHLQLSKYKASTQQVQVCCVENSLVCYCQLNNWRMLWSECNIL